MADLLITMRLLNIPLGILGIALLGYRTASVWIDTPKNYRPLGLLLAMYVVGVVAGAAQSTLMVEPTGWLDAYSFALNVTLVVLCGPLWPKAAQPDPDPGS